MGVRCSAGGKSGFGIHFRRSRFSFVGILCFVAPALAFYCWSSRSQDGINSAVNNRDARVLEPKSPYSPPDSWMQRFLNPIAYHRFEESLRVGRTDPFDGITGRSLAAMRGDPFMLALASGNSEGVLGRHVGKRPATGEFRELPGFAVFSQ